MLLKPLQIFATAALAANFQIYRIHSSTTSDAWVPDNQTQVTTYNGAGPDKNNQVHLILLSSSESYIHICSSFSGFSRVPPNLNQDTSISKTSVSVNLHGL